MNIQAPAHHPQTALEGRRGDGLTLDPGCSHGPELGRRDLPWCFSPLSQGDPGGSWGVTHPRQTVKEKKAGLAISMHFDNNKLCF